MKLRIHAVLKLMFTATAVAYGAWSHGANFDEDRKVQIEFERGGISAPLLDQGDYYQHPDGRTLKFYRKKDVYAIKKKTSTKAKSSIGTMQRLKAQFGERVKSVSGHQLGGIDVVRVDNRKAAKALAKQAFDIKPEMLKALDSSTQRMLPIFTSERGQGDLLLLPKVTLELNGSLAEADALAKLGSRYGLRLVRKLKLSADVYSMEFANTGIDAGVQFSQVRRIMNESFVAWAEPQFYVKPVKEQFTPNDTLIGDQWNLIDQGYRGSRCDTDCDANNAWAITNGVGAATGEGIVIAVIDDGVQLDHPDLEKNIWVNTLEDGGVAGVDDDGNGYIDDIKGYDFVNDDGPTVCQGGSTTFSDSDLTLSGSGQDANPSPRDVANCVLADDLLAEDNHGTAVAGILAAEGNNGLGIAGVAYNAQIMAIRAISDFNEDSLLGTSFCNTIAEAMEYAAQHADVINNSWSLPVTCSVLDTAMTRVTSGNVTVGLGSKRSGGSPIVFASGNDARGWIKVTVPVTAGEHAYEWRLLRTPDDSFTPFDDDTVWLDDIVWPDPDSTTESFESGINGFTNEWVLNSCNAICTENFGQEPVWDIETRSEFVRSGSQSARILASNSDCGNSYLHQIKDGPAGEISFWVWVSTDNQVDSDVFEFLIDGEEVLSYGDIPAFGFVDNAVAYPALNSTTNLGVIAVGSSNSGDLSGNTGALLTAEERAPYSQYGPELDLVAPSSDQHLGITTIDRTGADGYVSGDYTSNFGGTSASAPVVSGVAAAMLAVNPSLSATQVKTMLRDSADKIGPVAVAYLNGRNDFHGFGRVNMYGALLLANGDPLSSQSASCAADPFDYTVDNDLLLSRYEPQPTAFCPARGPRVPLDESCFVVKAANDNVITFCL